MRLADVYTDVCTLFAYRAWTVRESASVVPATAVRRSRFRVFARTSALRAVALFADVGSRPETATPPTVASIRDAVHAADDDSVRVYGAEASKLHLVVVLVHADGLHRIRSDAQAVIDAVDLADDGDGTNAKSMYIEHWHTRQLAVNVPAHEYVPHHRFASDEERRRYPARQLPRIRLSDPMARWLGAREHDIVVEERDDPDTGRSLYFRRVVAYGGGDA
jgi:DNA-directed RNA polymerase subunit H (RpoH/RPB5)